MESMGACCGGGLRVVGNMASALTSPVLLEVSSNVFHVSLHPSQPPAI